MNYIGGFTTKGGPDQKSWRKSLSHCIRKMNTIEPCLFPFCNKCGFLMNQVWFHNLTVTKAVWMHQFQKNAIWLTTFLLKRVIDLTFIMFTPSIAHIGHPNFLCSSIGYYTNVRLSVANCNYYERHIRSLDIER